MSSPIIARSPSPLAELDYLDMSHILASDAPIMSPVFDHDSSLPGSYPYSNETDMDFESSEQYNQTDEQPLPAALTSNYYDSAAPSPSDTMMRMRMDSGNGVQEGACMPTHQVFELESPAQQPHPEPLPVKPVPQQEEPIQSHKRSASRSLSPPSETIILQQSATDGSCSSSSGLAPGQKKQRGAVISTKDFIPPDVSGMSKREARLVKNRAAAFLSRQRKREEFEFMEVRVAELEKENARLLALAQGQLSSGSPAPSSAPASAPVPAPVLDEVESLRAQLAAAHEMIASSTQLHTMPSSPAVSNVNLPSPIRTSVQSSPRLQMKTEEVENDAISVPSRGNTKSSAASLGLMQVLLCALPSLLSSMPQAHTSSPAAFDIPMSPSWAFSSFGDDPAPFEWSDMNPTSTSSFSSSVKTLEVEGMDVSFDTAPAEDGKIRVRIHHPSSSGSAPSPLSSSPSPSMSFSSPRPRSSMLAGSHLANLTPGDPFLGVGETDFGGFKQTDMFDYTLDAPSYSRMGSPFGSDYGSEAGSTGSSMGSTPSAHGKRRVRIALKSMPESGGKEGGEWEVEFC